MVELLLLKTSAFYHLRQHQRHLRTRQLTVSLGHQLLGQLPLTNTHQKVLESQVIQRMLDFVIQTLHLVLQEAEIFVH